MRSMRRFAWLCIGAVLALTGCSHGSSYSYPYYTGKKNPRVVREQSEPPPKRASQTTSNNVKKQAENPKKYHIVEKGETLYSIAWQYGYDVREVAIWNRIQAPYTIYPQQKIRLVKTHYTKPQKPVSKRVITSKITPKSHVKNSNKSKTTRKISWQWPTKGKIIGKYSARDAGKKGLDIAGRKGQRIYAAAGGEVVYSGSGLRGYGKLIIIKHNDTYFSAYAHSNRLFVKEKQKVQKGQHIADMGSSEAQRVMLHFEVRRNGKPVDPLRYLPKRR
jgi:lipoprotein NlpD